jgi:hypothetical protein
MKHGAKMQKRFFSLIIIGLISIANTSKAQFQQNPTQQHPPNQQQQQSPNQSSIAATFEHLRRELSGANQTANRGDLWAAADQIYRALDSLETLNIGPIPPHFFVALEHARSLAIQLDAEVRNETRSWPDQSQARRFAGRVRYYTFARALEMALNAYVQLDARYFFVLPRSNCDFLQNQCNQPYFVGVLPREYFDGVKNLALRFLVQEREAGRLQGLDRIELVAIQTTARAASALLHESVFRREFRCIVHRLNILDRRVGELLLTRAIPLGDRTQEARALQDRAIQEFSRNSCELITEN